MLLPCVLLLKLQHKTFPSSNNNIFRVELQPNPILSQPLACRLCPILWDGWGPDSDREASKEFAVRSPVVSASSWVAYCISEWFQGVVLGWSIEYWWNCRPLIPAFKMLPVGPNVHPNPSPEYSRILPANVPVYDHSCPPFALADLAHAPPVQLRPCADWTQVL